MRTPNTHYYVFVWPTELGLRFGLLSECVCTRFVWRSDAMKEVSRWTGGEVVQRLEMFRVDEMKWTLLYEEGNYATS